MTDRGTARRRAATVALLPAVAAVFGGSVVWADTHDPHATTAPPTTNVPASTAADGEQGPGDDVLAALEADVQAVRDRLAALAASLADENAAATPAPAPAPAVAPSAPAAPPPVHVTTKASG